jgi:hypothetical protein
MICAAQKVLAFLAQHDTIGLTKGKAFQAQVRPLGRGRVRMAGQGKREALPRQQGAERIRLPTARDATLRASEAETHPARKADL